LQKARSRHLYIRSIKMNNLRKKKKPYILLYYSYSAYKMYSICIAKKKLLLWVTLLFMHKIKWSFSNTYYNIYIHIFLCTKVLYYILVYIWHDYTTIMISLIKLCATRKNISKKRISNESRNTIAWFLDSSSFLVNFFKHGKLNSMA